jgi:hypothetical protein
VEIKERDKTTQGIQQTQNLPEQETQNPSHQLNVQPQPADQHQTDDPLAKLLTDLIKIYNNDDKKYRREEYDIPDIKLQIFYDYCLKIGLLKAQYYYTYSAMLKRRASFFYYDKIVDRMYDFQTIVAITKTHFKTEENHQKYLFK